jgi:monoamine oxidase
VVGAGAAGLSAAYTLEYAGVPYTLLEADVVHYGGRMRQTNDFMDELPLDLGAEWIHVMPRILQDFILFEEDKEGAASIPIITYQPQTWSAFRRGKRRTRNWLRFFYQEYKFENSTWWSYFSDYFYSHVANNTVFDANVNRIEFNDDDDDDDSPAMDTRNPRRVTVSTDDGRVYSASHIILAVPVRILQDRDIVFIPQLEDKVWRTIDDIDVADGIKVWLEWDDKFYPDMQLTKSLLHGTEIQPLFFDAVFRKPTDRNVLCLFNVNRKEATALASRSDEEIIDYTLDLLEKIFDRSDLRDHLRKAMVLNWSREPFIRGAYTWNYGEYDQSILRRPLYEGRLFLAGEYLAKDHTATVHGAAIRGREAVISILNGDV